MSKWKWIDGLWKPADKVDLSRRSFLRGAGIVLAAPVIVKAASLMPISSFESLEFSGFESRIPLGQLVDMDELSALTRKAFIPRIFVQIYRSNPLIEMMAAQT